VAAGLQDFLWWQGGSFWQPAYKLFLGSQAPFLGGQSAAFFLTAG